MLAIENKKRFDEIVTAAIHKAIKVCDRQTAQRWINAIGKAVEMVETQPEFLHYDEKENYLVIWSQGSNNIYSANGICQCEAYQRHQPCKHRALARLIRNYLGMAENTSPTFPNESRAVSVPTSPSVNSSTRNQEMDNAVYLTPYRKEEPKSGGFRL